MQVTYASKMLELSKQMARTFELNSTFNIILSTFKADKYRGAISDHC